MRFDSSLWCFCVVLLCRETPHSNAFSFKNIGRSISSILGGSKTDNVRKENSFSKFQHVDTDDVFIGLSAIWSEKDSTNYNSNKHDAEDLLNSQIQLKTELSTPNYASLVVPKDIHVNVVKTNDNFIPNLEENQLRMTHAENVENNVNDDLLMVDSELFPEFPDKPNVSLEIYNETGDIDHWTRVKSIIGNMKSIFTQMYGENNEVFESLELLDKILSIGDKINVMKKIENTFDRDLLEYLHKKWDGAQEQLTYTSPLLKLVIHSDARNLFLLIAKGLLKQFSSLFHKQAFAHLNEQDFVIKMMRSSGFKDEEIYDVFNMLDLPVDELLESSQALQKDTVEGRFFGNNQIFDRSDSYGHSGTGGYGMMSQDPFILLAGLAFATFAAYIIYRLLSSTTGGRRSIPDIGLSLNLSDMPETISNIHSWLEHAEDVYVNEENIEMLDDSFGSSVNSLWRSYNIDRFGQSCVRRFLCENLNSNAFRTMTSGVSIQQLALIFLSELFGLEGAGRFFDNLQTRLFAGESMKCAREASSCDEVAYRSIHKGSTYLKKKNYRKPKP